MIRALPWLPAVLLTCIIVLHLAGVRMVSPAIGATSDTVEITGMVDKDVQMDMTGCSNIDALGFGVFSPDTETSTPADCEVMYGSNNSPAGASLLVDESPAAGAGATFKCIGGLCGTQKILDVPPGTTNAASLASAFGLTLRSTTGAATPVWTSGANPPWYPAADTPDTACVTDSELPGSCMFRFQVYASSTSINPGTFEGKIRFTVLPR